MKRLALGWACNLSDVFVRFPYEKCKNLIKLYKTKSLRKLKIKQVFRTSVDLVLNDIIENNATFQLPPMNRIGGEIHFEPVTGDKFMELRAKGKFKGIDFLETIFTGYLLHFYIFSRNDKFSIRKKIPVYMNSYYRSKMEKLANSGKTYC